MTVPNNFDYQALYAASVVNLTQGSMLTTIQWLVFLVVGIIKFSQSLNTSKSILIQNRFFVALLVITAASLFWSISPGVTFHQILRIVTVVTLCLAFAAASPSSRSFQSLLRPFFTAMMIGSIIFVFTYPEYAIEQSNQSELLGAWCGLTLQKNQLGALASLSSILWLHAWISKQVKQPWPLIGLLVSATCLLKSRSSTSIMATIFGAFLMLMLMRSPGSMKRMMPYFVGIFVSVILLYSLAVLNLVPGSDLLLRPIASITGKDLTFSGRTAIWNIINVHIRLNPLLGTGYGAYWIGEDPTSPSIVMVKELYFYPTEAHNGYLDIINDLGWVGEFLLLGYIINLLRKSLKLYALDRAQGALFLVIIFEQLIGNLSESMWFNVRVIAFVIMTLATMCVTRALQLHEAARLAVIQSNASLANRITNPAASQGGTNPGNRAGGLRSAFDRLRNGK